MADAGNVRTSAIAVRIVTQTYRYERERERDNTRKRDEQRNILMQRSPREIIRCRVLCRELADFKIIRAREGSARYSERISIYLIEWVSSSDTMLFRETSP